MRYTIFFLNIIIIIYCEKIDFYNYFVFSYENFAPDSVVFMFFVDLGHLLTCRGKINITQPRLKKKKVYKIKMYAFILCDTPNTQYHII